MAFLLLYKLMTSEEAYFFAFLWNQINHSSGKINYEITTRQTLCDVRP
jgi:hypothetical protein